MTCDLYVYFQYHSYFHEMICTQSYCICLNRISSYDFKGANCPGKVSGLHVEILECIKYSLLLE